MFLFIPQGGLCNRMRSIEAAIELSLQAGVSLTIQWHMDPGLNCEFEKLFEVPAVIDEINTINYTGGTAQLRKTISKRLNRIRYDKCFYERDLAALTGGDMDLVSFVRSGSVCIASCMEFYPVRNYFSSFQPVSRLQDIITTSVENMGEYVGVHIRRADHGVAIERSPVELFIAAMDLEVARDPNIRFFLATDCKDTEDRLKLVFSKRIFTHKKSSLDRGDGLAIEDAVIDLYCLASASKIIGSYSSSFSETAAQIKNIKINIIDVGDKMVDR
ncbi:MAG: hypothetical protein GXP13_03825 [Gammaproteobacteria bacterium]|nr:hypothetical protein [Gammaproteobacteria bacterium]